MAPDRGHVEPGSGPQDCAIVDENIRHQTHQSQSPKTSGEHNVTEDEEEEEEEEQLCSEAREFLGEHEDEKQNFTWRGVTVGLGIGIIICFSNTYFGLQTGWVSGMAMPAALIGFAFFKTIAKYLDYPFTPVENVLVQTVAGALGTMPLGCGFVGVLPALNFLLKPEENGPLVLGTWKLMVWAVGICFFGVFIAVPLRKEVIIREKLKFPSGTATALMIGVLHGNADDTGNGKKENPIQTFRRRSGDMLRPTRTGENLTHDDTTNPNATADESDETIDHRDDWKAKIRLLVLAFALSAIYTLISYFIPQLHNLPVFGLPLATDWLWTLNPSPAYVGQGIIMGPATTLHMLLGTIIGWGVLSPIAKQKGWAPGHVDDWDKGSKGWIVWVSLAIMLADSVVSLGWLLLRPTLHYVSQYLGELRERARRGNLPALFRLGSFKGDYEPLSAADQPVTRSPISNSLSHFVSRSLSTPSHESAATPDKDLPEPDAPAEHLISNRVVCLGLLASIVVCIISVHLVFGSLVPLHATVIAILLAMLLSLMGVRALGETDLNPVSGISKLTQLAFALIIPSSNPNAIIINLLAGAISESGALQAGDMMQDLKTGHLLGAAPKAQFYGQLIGSFVGAIVSAAVYKLYTSVYEIPGGMFDVPTGYVWIFTARLVTGKGLPEMAWQWALGAGAVFAVGTAIRIVGREKMWQAFIPGGIAVAVGMYNVPSFTLARTIGGLISWYWRSWKGREEAPVIVLASGLILGEGVMSIVSLGLASLKIPHL